LKPEFDAAKPNGGNPDIENVNTQYQGLEYHYIYMMIMAYLVWLIIPGIGFLYSGLSRRKSALAMLFQSFAVMGVYVLAYLIQL
jgi:Amt family ammonium transporter